jgi:hypothetical protein
MTFNEILILLCTGIALSVLLITLFVVICIVVDYITNCYISCKRKEIRRVYISQLTTLNRYLSPEFPEVSFVLEKLITNWNADNKINADLLREESREKRGELN